MAATLDPTELADTALCPACRNPNAGEATTCARCAQPVLLDGRYRIVGELGRGGSSNAFTVVRIADGERFALKLLNVAHIDDWKVLDHFRRQLGILGGLSHDGIPRGIEHFAIELAGVPCECLVQELVPGTSLKEELERGTRRYDEASARRFLEQMLDILAYLHGFSPPVIHRDIKPANIMMRPDGSAPVLIDFDTARGHAIDHSIADGTMVGTAGYVPAEQLAGRAMPASDLYSLGMTLVHMLSLRDPTDLPVERMRVQFEGFVNVSPAFAAVLRGMIEPIVEDRFADVAAVRGALAAPPAPRRDSPRRETKAPAAPPRARTREREREQDSGSHRRKRRGKAEVPSRAPGASDVVTPRVPGAVALDASMRELSDGFRSAGTAVGVAVRAAASVTNWKSERRYVWPIAARASTSYASDHDASQAVGAPKVFPAYGDRAGAWAPASSTDSIEWLEVDFPDAAALPPAIQVHVFETFNPGAVYAVEVTLSDGARRIVLVAKPAAVRGDEAQRLEVKLPEPMRVVRCRVWLETRIGSSWNELDTIALLAQQDVTAAAPVAVPGASGFVSNLDSPVWSGDAASEPRAVPRKRRRRGPRGRVRRLAIALGLVLFAALIVWILVRTSDPLRDLPVDETLPDTRVETRGGALPSDAVWASRLARQSSSYGGNATWHGQQALGAPDVYPTHGDHNRAWASEAEDAGIEYLTVGFPAAVETKTVVIVETFNPGAVVRVDDLSGGGAVALWEGTTSPGSGARQMVLHLAQPRAIDTLRVVLDTREVSGWNELDAIGLVPVAP